MIRRPLFATIALLTIVPVAQSSPLPPVIGLPDDLWLSIELLSFVVKPNCLPTNTTCSRPKLEVNEHLTTAQEVSAFSWPLTSSSSSPNRRLVAQWRQAQPKDARISMRITGVDDMYGFPTLCDRSAVVAPLYAANSTPIENEHEDLDEGGVQITLRGRCFTAELRLRHRRTNCPSCATRRQQQAVEAELADKEQRVAIRAMETIDWRLVTAGCALFLAGALLVVILVMCISGKWCKSGKSSSSSSSSLSRSVDSSWMAPSLRGADSKKFKNNDNHIDIRPYCTRASQLYAENLLPAVPPPQMRQKSSPAAASSSSQSDRVCSATYKSLEAHLGESSHLHQNHRSSRLVVIGTPDLSQEHDDSTEFGGHFLPNWRPLPTARRGSVIVVGGDRGCLEEEEEEDIELSIQA